MPVGYKRRRWSWYNVGTAGGVPWRVTSGNHSSQSTGSGPPAVGVREPSRRQGLSLLFPSHSHPPPSTDLDVVSPIPEARTQFLKAGIWDDKRAAIAEGGVIAYV